MVDIGSTKTSVCCIDDGIILPKTQIKKHFGGDDISELLLRFVKSSQSLHYFPEKVFYPLQYPYHKMLLEAVKENYSALQMNDSNKDLVKNVTLWLKEQNIDKF